MKKRRQKETLPFMEGTWFAIPLRQSGYAIGRVARQTRNGEIILAYLFAPKWKHVPAVDEIGCLQPEDAVKVLMVGGLGLIDGTWPVIGDSSSWDRERWPIPAFVRRDDLSRTAWRVVYSDDDPNRIVVEERIPYETTELEPNSLYGHKAAESYLSQILET